MVMRTFEACLRCWFAAEGHSCGKDKGRTRGYAASNRVWRPCRLSPEARLRGGLVAETVEHGRYRGGILCRGDLGSGLCAEQSHGSALGVPASAERGKVRPSACGVV
jgi:hypothetical protein